MTYPLGLMWIEMVNIVKIGLAAKPFFNLNFWDIEL